MVVVLVCVYLIYAPALHGPFVFDDGPNITDNPALKLTSLSLPEIRFAMESVESGPLGRPLAYLTFALNHYFFGPSPYSFKLINLIIHLVNGLCVFVLTKILLRCHGLAFKLRLEDSRIQWLAVATTALWLLHPLALTSVLYVVQRMNSLATLFCLLGFIAYFAGRLRQFEQRNGIWQYLTALCVFFPLAVLCKENALLLPYLLLVTDWLLLGFRTSCRVDKVVLGLLLFSVIVPIALVFSTPSFFWKYLLDSYLQKPFTLGERVLTESRVIWFYLKLIFIPAPADFGLYHDDIELSKGWFQPITTAISVGALLVLAALALFLRKLAPILSFGLLFFLIGHGLESSIFPLEIAHEHRNYLPMFAMVFLLSYYSLHPWTLAHAAHFVIPGFVLLIAVFATLTVSRVADWQDIGKLAQSLVLHHPNSSRSNYEAGRLLSALIEENPDAPNVMELSLSARQFFTRAYQRDQLNPSGLFGIVYLDGLLGRQTDRQTAIRLTEHLSRAVLPAATASLFASLNQCRGRGRCRFDRDMLVLLHEATLNNQNIGNTMRSSLSNELAILKLEQHDVHAAIDLFKNSIALRPKEAQLRFNLVLVLIDSGRVAEAAEQLRLIREQIPRIRERHKLANLEGKLAKRQAAMGLR